MIFGSIRFFLFLQNCLRIIWKQKLKAYVCYTYACVLTKYIRCGTQLHMGIVIKWAMPIARLKLKHQLTSTSTPKSLTLLIKFSCLPAVRAKIVESHVNPILSYLSLASSPTASVLFGRNSASSFAVAAFVVNMKESCQ